MSGKTRALSKILPEILFPLLIVAIGVYVFADSFNYQFETRAFATVASSILTVLSIILLIRETAKGIKNWETESRSPKENDDGEMRTLLIGLIWCVAFFFGMLLIGIIYIVPLWVLAFLVWSKASRITAITMPILLWALIQFGLVSGLGPIFFEGILFGGRLPIFW